MTWRRGLGFVYAAVLLVLAFGPILMSGRRGLRAPYQRHIMTAQAICLALVAVVLVLTAGPWDLSRWDSWILVSYILALVAALIEYRRAARAKRAAQTETSAPTV